MNNEFPKDVTSQMPTQQLDECSEAERRRPLSPPGEATEPQLNDMSVICHAITPDYRYPEVSRYKLEAFKNGAGIPDRPGIRLTGLAHHHDEYKGVDVNGVSIEPDGIHIFVSRAVPAAPDPPKEAVSTWGTSGYLMVLPKDVPAAPEPCEECVISVIAGTSWIACALLKGHSGGHRGKGNCFKHGEYLGAEGALPQCPQWGCEAVSESGGQPDWHELKVGMWFFHESPSCTDRYCVMERTLTGCHRVTPFIHDEAKRQMQEIVDAHNRAASQPSSLMTAEQLKELRNRVWWLAGKCTDIEGVAKFDEILWKHAEAYYALRAQGQGQQHKDQCNCTHFELQRELEQVKGERDSLQEQLHTAELGCEMGERAESRLREMEEGLLQIVNLLRLRDDTNSPKESVDYHFRAQELAERLLNGGKS